MSKKNIKLNVMNSKQKFMWLSKIKNNNKFNMKLSKYIGWKKLSEKYLRSKMLKKYYDINKGYVYYSR